MIEIPTTPLKLGDVFTLLSQFDPDHWHLVLAAIQNLVAVDPASRDNLGDIADALMQGAENGPSPAVLYLDSALQDARRLWQEELSAVPPRAIGEHVEAQQGSIVWGLSRFFVEESTHLVRRDHEGGLALAHAATSLARRAPLLPFILGPQERKQLEGLALAAVANVLRSTDQLEAARHLLDESAPCFVSDSLGYRARALCFQASLEISERGYFQALRTLDEALSRTSEPDLRARIYLKRAIVWGYSDDEIEALNEVQQAHKQLDGRSDSWLGYCVAHHHVDFLSRLHRFGEAEAYLPSLWQALGSKEAPKERLHLQWVEARVAIGQARFEEGEAQYHRVRQGFLELELPYFAAVVTVELARHFFQQHRFQEVAELATESVTEFRRQGVKQEILGAVALLKDAHRGQLSLEIVGQILKRVQRAARER